MKYRENDAVINQYREPDEKASTEEILASAITGLKCEIGSISRMEALNTILHQLSHVRTRNAAADYCATGGIGKELLKIILDPYQTEKESRIIVGILKRIAFCASGQETKTFMAEELAPAMLNLCRSCECTFVLEDAFEILQHLYDAHYLSSCWYLFRAMEYLQARCREDKLFLEWWMGQASEFLFRYPSDMWMLAIFVTEFLGQSNQRTVVLALEFLTRFSTESPSHQDRLIESTQLLDQLIELLKGDEEVTYLALRLINSLVSAPAVAHLLLDSGVLNAVIPVLGHYSLEMRCEACEIFAEVVSESFSTKEVDQLILAGVLDPLLLSTKNFKVKATYDALKCVGSLFELCSAQHIPIFLSKPPFLHALHLLILSDEESFEFTGMRAILRLCKWSEAVLPDEANPFVEVNIKFRSTFEDYSTTFQYADDFCREYLDAPRPPGQPWLPNLQMPPE